jgi:hypothetical protein
MYFNQLGFSFRILALRHLIAIQSIRKYDKILYILDKKYVLYN